jgi:hypothetical protein
MMDDEPRVDAVADDPGNDLGAPEELETETQASDQPAASPADIESRVEARIRASEERLARQFASMLERVNQSNRDATKARVEDVKAYFDQLYRTQSQAITDLGKQGRLDPRTAMEKQAALQQSYATQAAAEANRIADAGRSVRPLAPPETLATEARRSGGVNVSDDLRVWENRKRDILDALERTGREPEWDEVMSRWRTPRDQEDAAAQFRTLAKELRKRVDARVNRKAEARETIQPPVIETGATGSSTPTDAENELSQLIEKGPPAHPKRVRAWEKRIDELSKHLGW